MNVEPTPGWLVASMVALQMASIRLLGASGDGSAFVFDYSTTKNLDAILPIARDQLVERLFLCGMVCGELSKS